MGIARNLMILRSNHFLSIAEVATKVGVSRQAVNQWERGESAPTKKYLKVICELYGVTQAQLYSEDIEKAQKKEEEKQVRDIVDYRDKVISLLESRVQSLEKELAECVKKKGG